MLIGLIIRDMAARLNEVRSKCTIMLVWWDDGLHDYSLIKTEVEKN